MNQKDYTVKPTDESKRPRVALLIDAENINPSFAGQVLAAAQKHGDVVIRRAYADWAVAAKGWKQACLTHSIAPIHHFSFSSGKNSTDFYMIIDAMDLLHDDQADCFCIASSDSDFLALAVRLKKSGKAVVGVGTGSVTPAWKEACTFWEVCKEPQQPKPAAAPKAKVASKAKPPQAKSQAICAIVDEQLASVPTGLSMQEMNERIIARQPDFTPDQFGWRRLRTVLDHWGYSLEQRGRIWYVMPRGAAPTRPTAEQICQILNQLLAKEKRILLSDVCPNIMRVEPNFRLSHFGKKKTRPLLEEWGYKIIVEGHNQYVSL